MSHPNVLCISGHDPSGGAGLQADIEAVAAQGAHAAGVITALTRQDTHNAYAVTPVADREFSAQLDTLVDDMTFAAVKVGLLGSAGQARRIAKLMRQIPGVPLVLDPVLVAGGGATLAESPVARAMTENLLEITTLLTPNASEARHLCPGKRSLDDCGDDLARFAQWVLITGGDEPGDTVTNTLYNADGVAQHFRWPRLPHHYHGSGCTLASACAARLALGDPVLLAVRTAQDYAWHSLEKAFQPGRGQHIPNRIAPWLA